VNFLFPLCDDGIENSSDRTNEIEIDNDTPCDSLCLEGCGGVEELELFEGGALATLTLPQEEDLNVWSAPFEACTLCAKLFIDCIADTFGILFSSNAGIALSGGLIERGTKDGFEKVCSVVLGN